MTRHDAILAVARKLDTSGMSTPAVAEAILAEVPDATLEEIVAALGQASRSPGATPRRTTTRARIGALRAGAQPMRTITAALLLLTATPAAAVETWGAAR